MTRKVTYSCPWPYKHVSSVLQLSLQMMSYNKIYYTPFRNNLKVSESNPDMKDTLVWSYRTNNYYLQTFRITKFLFLTIGISGLSIIICVVTSQLEGRFLHFTILIQLMKQKNFSNVILCFLHDLMRHQMALVGNSKQFTLRWTQTAAILNFRNT